MKWSSVGFGLNDWLGQSRMFHLALSISFFFCTFLGLSLRYKLINFSLCTFSLAYNQSCLFFRLRGSLRSCNEPTEVMLVYLCQVLSHIWVFHCCTKYQNWSWIHFALPEVLVASWGAGLRVWHHTTQNTTEHTNKWICVSVNFSHGMVAHCEAFSMVKPLAP